MASRRKDAVGSSPVRLVVDNFAQIHRAELELGDLTILVGPQGSGKSLLLQLFKLAVDKGEILQVLTESGHDTRDPKDLLDLFFGQGMRKSWSKNTRVRLDQRQLTLKSLTRAPKTPEGHVFYIPAHRALLLAEGWPAPFLRLNADTPAVARLFSQKLYDLFANPKDTDLFPVSRRLKKGYRTAIDDAVFHGGKVRLEKKSLRKQLKLEYEGAQLPFMTWTAGQREFTPLLLGLYHLLPSRKLRKQDHIDWVIIEEPEMGLHPQAISIVMLLALDLLWRGYRVIMSTHAPLVLDVLFMLQKLKETGGPPKDMERAFALPKSDQAVRTVVKAALKKSYKTYFLSFDEDGRVSSTDISQLDPSGPPDEADWGGLTGFSSRINDVVADAMIRAERNRYG